MTSSKKALNPAAQKALDQLKEETAANGRVGGQMVRKMIQAQEEKFSTK